MSVSVLPTSVAGRRVVRALAHDDRADLLLLRDDSGRSVVAKLFASEVPRTAIDRELTALARVAHPHVLALLDAETAPDGRVVALVPQLTRGTLARWLEARDRVAAGEAVTVLAPLASAIAAAHGAGVAHGRLASTRVLFDAAGAPVVTGFGAAVLFAPGAPDVARERVPEVFADLEALRSIADTTLARVAGPGSRAAEDLRARIGGAAPLEIGTVLVDGLFAFSAGAPIRFDLAAPADVGGTRAVPVVGATGSTPRRGLAELFGFAQVLGIADMLDRAPGRIVRDRIRAIWRGFEPGRRRLVVGVLAAGAAALVAVLLVPGSERSTAAPRETPVAATPAGSSPAGSTAPRAERTASAAPASADEAAVVGDDPLAAFAVLVRTRQRCLRDQDERCLDAVDESGSPAARADAAGVAGGTGATLSGEGARLAQQWGGSALIESGDPSMRVLLVRGSDGGWRIRDLPTEAVG